MSYVIGCKSDGMLGVRESVLKKDGVVMTFKTREEAEKAMPESRTLVNGTVLKYWVEEEMDDDGGWMDYRTKRPRY